LSISRRNRHNRRLLSQDKEHCVPIETEVNPLMNLMCTRCKQRMAIIFVSRMENGQPVNDGYCLQCAKELGLPHVQEMLDRLGVSEDDLETISGQMMDLLGNEDNFNPGGAMPFPAFLQNFIASASPDADGAASGNPELADSELANAPQEPTGISLPLTPPERKSGKPNGKKQDKKRKFLDNYCENLTDKAAEGKIDRIVGRDREIYRVMQILNRRQKNNPCLIGEPGVGKTAIAEGIAQRLADGNVPPRLMDKELFLLDLTALVAGTQFRGQFESRVKGLVEEIKEAGNVILFIDEVHNLIGAGDAEGSMNAANILKPALSRGEIQVIGATTFNEYRLHIEKDAALERRFQPVTVNEPSLEDTVQVLMSNIMSCFIGSRFRRRWCAAPSR
ncbi:MAG: AAA family ATPase, partial [Oscillospiraceae bacterium]